MEIVISSAITALAIVFSSIIATYSTRKNKYFISKIESLSKTRENLAKDWLFFYEVEKIALEEIENATSQNKESKKIHFRKMAEKNTKIERYFSPNQIKRFI